MRSRDLTLLCPAFRQRLDELLMRLKNVNLPFYVFEAFRTFEDQNELYAQGRTKPGKIVTNARGGDSLHNYGLAADLVLDGMPEKPGIQWSWDIRADLNKDRANDWKQMAEIARDCRLEAGYFWKRFPDAPHVQCTFGLTLPEIKEIYHLEGIKSLWAICEEIA